MRRCLLALLVACCPDPKPAAKPTAAMPWSALVDKVLADLIAHEPGFAIGNGFHEHDGELADRSPKGIADEIAAFKADLASLDAAKPSTMLERDEHDLLANHLRTWLFNAETLDGFHRNPMAYADLSLDDYIVRDYAPSTDRAAALGRACAKVPAQLAQARANLTKAMPRTWLETALLQTKGMGEFLDKDVRLALPEAAPHLDACKAAFAEHAAWLEQQLPNATNDFALGEQQFLAMLSAINGIDTTLPALQKLVDDDLARNTAAITEAAHAIDATKPVPDVVFAQAADHAPDADKELAIATEQAAMLRKFLVDHDIVTIPTNDVAEVRASPPFQRWNAAFLSEPGAFEKKQLPSFYYISPPDPTWSPADQAAYLIPTNDLLFTTIHEVYPGHFVDGLHRRTSPSKVLRMFGTYATTEGWAHYAEEMMFDAGAGGKTPQTHIGQLKEALLRDVRFEVALGEHAHGMSVDAATELFKSKGFVDAGNAKQQAVRGTFDPMFLSYTLGKLIIRKLYADWHQANPGKSLKEFHDAFLAHGGAPLSTIRRDLLGNDSPVL